MNNEDSLNYEMSQVASTSEVKLEVEEEEESPKRSEKKCVDIKNYLYKQERCDDFYEVDQS